MKVSDLRERTKDELKDLLNGLVKELHNLNLRRGIQELPNPLRLRILRRDIARVKTFLREEELGIRKISGPKKKTK